MPSAKKVYLDVKKLCSIVSSTWYEHEGESGGGEDKLPVGDLIGLFGHFIVHNFILLHPPCLTMKAEAR
jgi:hypothetical protein